MNHVEIKSPSATGIPTYVKVDGTDIRCKEITYHVAVDEAPEVDLVLPSAASVDVDCVARLHFDPQNIIDANAIIRHELLTQGDYYGGFLGSVESALAESGTCTNIHDLAQAIIDRIVGYEWDDDF